jgi:hypothetical protein
MSREVALEPIVRIDGAVDMVVEVPANSAKASRAPRAMPSALAAVGVQIH